jgi:signal transduction histidine kinase
MDKFHREYDIPRERILEEALPHIKEITGRLSDLSQALSGVDNDLKRGLSITNQIHEYARLSELKPGSDQIDLMALFRGYEDRNSRGLESHAISYVVEGPDSLIVRSEETHMNSIFSNLINNAKEALLEHETKNGEISITVGELKEKEDSVAVKIQDNGPGIPQKDLDEIFEPFFTTKPGSGTGLGLGIVKRLVHLYGGRIDVESGEDKGTLFTVVMPLHIQR